MCFFTLNRYFCPSISSTPNTQCPYRFSILDIYQFCGHKTVTYYTYRYEYYQVPGHIVMQ